jgi:hypothetical protein
MRYRVGGPLIDGLMAELGMNGSSLNGLLAGSATGETPMAAPSPAAVVAPAAPLPVEGVTAAAPKLNGGTA